MKLKVMKLKVNKILLFSLLWLPVVIFGQTSTKKDVRLNISIGIFSADTTLAGPGYSGAIGEVGSTGYNMDSIAVGDVFFDDVSKYKIDSIDIISSSVATVWVTDMDSGGAPNSGRGSLYRSTANMGLNLNTQNGSNFITEEQEAKILTDNFLTIDSLWGTFTWLKPELEAGNDVIVNALSTPTLSLQDLGSISIEGEGPFYLIKQADAGTFPMWFDNNDPDSRTIIDAFDVIEIDSDTGVVIISPVGYVSLSAQDSMVFIGENAPLLVGRQGFNMSRMDFNVDTLDATDVTTFINFPGNDNLGNHIMTQNLETSGFWLSNDGDNEGIQIDTNGYVSVLNDTITYPFQVITDLGLGAGLHSFGGFLRKTSGAGNGGFLMGYSANGSSVDYSYIYGPGGADLALATFDGAAFTTPMYIENTGNVGIGTSSPEALLHVTDPTFPVVKIERTITTTPGGARATANIKALVDVDMPDGFGPVFTFSIEDDAAVENTIGWFGAVRSGADNSGRLVFTPYNAGVANESMFIMPTGEVGIGTSSPSTKLHVSADGNTLASALYSSTSDHVIISNGTAAQQTGLRLITSENTTAGLSPALVFMRTRGTLASPTIVQDGDQLGAFTTQGYDGSARRSSSQIKFEIDGVPGVADMPGRIVFSTTPDGSSSPADRMTIKNDGKVGIGTSSPGAILEVKNASGTGSLWVSSEDVGATGNSQIQMRTDHKAAMTTGKRMGLFTFGGSTDGVGSISIGGAVSAYTTENWTGAATGTELRFETIANGAIVRLPRLTIGNAGAILFNNYGSGTFTGTPTRALQVDASGNVIEGALLEGSGTLNYVPKWTPDGTTLGNSQIRDDGSQIGINIAPTAFSRVRIDDDWSTGTSRTGIWTSAEFTGNTLAGSSHYALYNSTFGNAGNHPDLYGVYNIVQQSGGTGATGLYGTYNFVSADTGGPTVTNMYGNYDFVTNTAAITTGVYGSYTYAFSGSSSATTTLYGKYIQARGDVNVSGNKYGLYVINELNAGGNDYGIYQTVSGTTAFNILNSSTSIGSTSDPAYTIDVTGDARISALPTLSQTYVVNSTSGGVLGKELASNFTLNGIFDPRNDQDSLSNLTVNVAADTTLTFAVDSDAGKTPTLFKVQYDYSADDAFNVFATIESPGDTTTFQNYDNGFQINSSDDFEINAGVTSFGIDYLRLDSDSIKLYGEYTMPVTDGNPGDVMTTNGYGQVSWTGPAYVTMRESGGSTTVTSGTDEAITNDTPGTTTTVMSVGGVWTVSAGSITYTGTPDIDVLINVSLSSSTSSPADMIYEIAIEGVVEAETTMQRDHGGTDNGSISLLHMVTLSTNDTVEVFVDCAAGTETVNNNNLLMSIHKLD